MKKDKSIPNQSPDDFDDLEATEEPLTEPLNSGSRRVSKRPQGGRGNKNTKKTGNEKVTMCEVALSYAEAGLSVIPVGKDKKPVSYLLPRVNDPENGEEKHSWKPYQDQIADEETIRKWFKAKEQNIAIVTGEVSGNLLAIDFETPEHFELWKEHVGSLANDLVIQKSGRGYHVLVRGQLPRFTENLAYVPDDHEPSGRKCVVETRGEGACIVAAPSIHKNGHQYQVIQGEINNIPIYEEDEIDALLQAVRDLDETPLDQTQLAREEKATYAPKTGDGVIDKYNQSTDIKDILRQNGYTVVRNRARRPKGKSLSVSIKDGRSFHHSSNDPMSDGYWHDAFDIYCHYQHHRDVKAAVKEAAQRYTSSVTGTSDYKKPDSQEIDSLLLAAKNATGSEKINKLMDLAEKCVAMSRLERSMIADQVKAFGLTGKREFLQAIKEAEASARKSGVPGIIPTIPTDDELADRWIAKYPHTAYGLGAYRRYTDGIWPELPEHEFQREILAVLKGAKLEGIDIDKTLLNSVAELTRIQIATRQEIWDADPDYLPLRNGVLQISTRQLLPHSPDYYFTSGPGFDYEPDAKCTSFTQVIEGFPQDIRGFLQEFAGYCLTTDTSHEIAVWLYGLPGGGKSTILEGLNAMLGKRAGILSLAQIERSRFALADLVGKTLVFSMEGRTGKFASTDVLNAIISGETLTVERKFKDPYSIIPKAKVMWAMNTLPDIGDKSNGLFRRVFVVPIDPLPEKNRDPNLKQAVKSEGAGILNWALEGLARLQERGQFDIPRSIRGETDKFKMASDLPARFVEECCVVEPQARTQAKELYDLYCAWCKRTGHQPESMTDLAKDWQRLGFERYESRGRHWWRGVEGRR